MAAKDYTRCWLTTWHKKAMIPAAVAGRRAYATELLRLALEARDGR